MSSSRATYRRVAPLIDRARQRVRSATGFGVGEVLRNGDIACGQHGCVLSMQDPRIILKITDDAREARAADVVRRAQARGRAGHIAWVGAVVDLGEDRGVPWWGIVREAIEPWRAPAMEAAVLYDLAVDMLQASQRKRLPNPKKLASWNNLSMFPSLGSVQAAYLELHRLGLVSADITADNVGVRTLPPMKPGWPGPGALVIHDLGESRYVAVPNGARGAARQACPQDDAINEALEVLLGSRPPSACSLVTPAQMNRVVRAHNWPSALGVVGFHTEPDRNGDNHVLVLDEAPWSTLHEKIHDAGLDDKEIGRWLCEGLTEHVADQVRRSWGFLHKPTYPLERQLVSAHILGPTKMSPVAVARVVIHSKDPVADLASHLKRTHPNLSGTPLRRVKAAIRSGSGHEPDGFLNLVGGSP